MRHLTRVLCSTAAVMAVTAGCGGSGSTSTGRSQPAVFPLTITRSGGIAGFHDVLVVAGDGLVSATHKGQEPRRCQLTPSAVQQLTRAASQVPWARISPAGTRPAFPDDMVTTVQSPAGGPVRLEDPQAGQPGQVFQDLLNDLTHGPTGSRMCTPL